MTRRSRAEAQETKEKLIDSALIVFRERGVASPSLTDVATNAGLTRGAIYVHFENKSDLFAALLERSKLPYELFGGWTPSGETALAKLQDAITMVLTATGTNADYRWILEIAFHKCEKLDVDGPVVQRLRAARAQAKAFFGALVAEAVAQGELNPDLDIELTCTLLVSSINGIVSQWLLHGEFDLAEQAPHLAEGFVIMLHGSSRTAPPPG